VVLGLVAAAAASSSCKVFEREVTALEQVDEKEGLPLFSLTGSVEVETRTTGPTRRLS
jgi:hypothetical protein